MGNVVSITFDKLDELEKQKMNKSGYPSANLRYRIGEKEEVLFCYHEITFDGTLVFWILTNFKIIANEKYKPSTITEIMLNEINRITLDLALFSSNGIIIEAEKNFTLFEGVNDKNWLEKISAIIQKAKADLYSRMRTATISATPSSGQNLIADQLQKLADLYKSGILTEDEYKRAKERVLSKDM